MKAPWRSSTLCSSTASKGAARKITRIIAIAVSTPWPMRSVGWMRWRIAMAAISGLEQAQAVRQDAQLQVPAGLQALLGQEIERQVHGERLAEAFGNDAHVAVGAEELDLLDARIHHVRISRRDGAGHDVLRAQIGLHRTCPGNIAL